MNVLLAEANVPYDQLYEMDEINPAFEQTDVALISARTTSTNPAARSRIREPDLRHADPQRRPRQERRRAQALDEPGFAGIDNPLFVDPKTSMLFGDAKALGRRRSSPHVKAL